MSQSNARPWVGPDESSEDVSMKVPILTLPHKAAYQEPLKDLGGSSNVRGLSDNSLKQRDSG